MDQRLTRALRASAAALALCAGALLAVPAGALSPAYNLDGTWQVTLYDVACEGATQGPFPMAVTGFNESTGDFDWSFHSGASTGTGVESGDAVVFNSFGGANSPDLTASAGYDNGVLTMTSVVGHCQNNGGTNEWIFTSSGDLVVNSTKDTTDATEAQDGVCNVDPTATGSPVCTLAQAILVSNDQGGDRIAFDIKRSSANSFDGAVPRIEVRGSPLPAITAPATIDGTTESVGRVEVSGTAVDTSSASAVPTRGLDLAAGSAGSAVTGLVVNGFNDQVELAGGDATLQGDWLGTDVAGSKPDWDPLSASARTGQLAQVGVDLTSAGNQVGGPSSGQAVVIALSWESRPGSPSALTREVGAIDDRGAGGNVIQGDEIGETPSGDTIVDARPAGTATSLGIEPGLDLAGADTVGGTGTGDANAIAGAYLTGPAVVQGNTIVGTVEGLAAATLGGPTPTPGTGAGNVLEPSPDALGTAPGVSDANAGLVIEGNLFENPHRYPMGPDVVVDVSGATVGGPLAADGNSFTGVPVRSYGAVEVIGPGGDVIEYNTFTNNAVAGVDVRAGAGTTITRNSMVGNAQGIEFASLGYVFNPKVYANPTGPNNEEEYPGIDSVTSDSSGLTVTGAILQSGGVVVDVYGQTSCASLGSSPGQGEVFLGTQTFSSVLGDLGYSVVLGAPPAGVGAVTLTATGSDGSTSEFSPCLALNQKAPGLLGAGVAPTATTVAVSPGAAPAVLAARLAGSRAEATTGHATLELLCPGGATSPCTGTASVTVAGVTGTESSGSFSMPAGTVSPFTLTIKRSLFRRLFTVKRLTARLTTSATDGSGAQATRTFTITLTAP